MTNIFDLIYSEDIVKSEDGKLKILLDHLTGAYFIKYKKSGLSIFNDSEGNKIIYVKSNLSYTDDNDITYEIPKGKYIESDEGKIILNSKTEEVVLEQAYLYFKTKQKYRDSLLEDVHLN
ncbi:MULTISPECIES: hypothetical protein [unclassified Chryseobacterium]|uniref:hypothetical protein n=1 Tax=unclassified Chryseobacterium TaxID=2593645 RepID=UPI002897FE06|nr:hypothetical protein [Chryseobacterium sp.]